jgi:hypothetical protein
MAHKWLVKATNHTFTRLLLLLHTKKRISSVQGAPVGIRFDRNKFKLTKEMQDHLFIRWGDFPPGIGKRETQTAAVAGEISTRRIGQCT